ncbi:MAG: LysM peptidoglycan-binding domain-containing protein, partial [Deltaproteobacteria bacterium]|nr:LysM peptidoglycan-binding domain-containing protein [Deltaproteobacteria bacterium]
MAVLKSRKLFIFVYVIFYICIIASYPSESAIIDKTYIVKYDKGWDILCEPYIVQRNDWVFKLFRQKGEISHKNFLEFINIFKRINPHIRNIDLIRPSQRILIPLKKLNKDILPGQSSGIITIPFITISNLPEIIKPLSTEHIVQNGEFISRIIARGYGSYGTKSYKERLALFKLINPDVVDLNRIYPGQKLYIPKTSVRNKPWYKSIFDSLGNIVKDTRVNIPIDKKIVEPKPLSAAYKGNDTATTYPQVASILDAKLFNKGVYYFPRHEKEDFALNLSKFPVIECKNGTRMVLSGENINAADLNAIKSYWRGMKIVPVIPEASVEHVFDSVFKIFEKNNFKKQLSFSDKGVDVEARGKWIVDRHSIAGGETCQLCITLINNRSERISDSIVRYFEQHNIIIKDILLGKKAAKQKSAEPEKNNRITDVVNILSTDSKTFVKDLMAAMGYEYTQDVRITFPYAGIQIEALSNLITTCDGHFLFVDFGDLYGDALEAIEKTGRNIIQITNKDNKKDIISKIFRAANLSYINNPTFLAAKRPVVFNASFTIPGFLISDNE